MWSEIFYDRRRAVAFKQMGYAGHVVDLNPRAFVRMLAKIAHAQAVADFGVDGFEPMLQSVILCDCWRRWLWFIGEIEDPRPPREDVAHWVRARAILHEDMPLLLANIRLFANLNGRSTK